jgi:hypothetical protein
VRALSSIGIYPASTVARPSPVSGLAILVTARYPHSRFAQIGAPPVLSLEAQDLAFSVYRSDEEDRRRRKERESYESSFMSSNNGSSYAHRELLACNHNSASRQAPAGGFSIAAPRPTAGAVADFASLRGIAVRRPPVQGSRYRFLRGRQIIASLLLQLLDHLLALPFAHRLPFLLLRRIEYR